MAKKNRVREEIKKREFVNQAVAAAALGIAFARKRKVLYLQPYFYQGGKWHKLTNKGA